MKVLRMEASEFCRLRFVEIDANGESVVLSGRNAKGADLQLWVERVVADVPGAVEIEDGTVRS
jgi:hypothetical protein